MPGGGSELLEAGYIQHLPVLGVDLLEDLAQDPVRILEGNLTRPHPAMPAAAVLQHQLAHVHGGRPIQDAVTGKPYHPEVCAVLDVATRLAVGWSTGLAESALTVASAIRHAATVNEHKPYGGIFDILYTDGGSGNMAKINADDATGLFARIGTTFATGRPGNPQGRGLIEKSNQSIWIRSAKLLPAYTGKSMDKGARRNMYLAIQRDFRSKGYSDHLLSWKQFLEYCQEAVDSYNNRPHSALPKLTDPETGCKRHMTPLECWAWHVADGWKPEEHQLSETEVEVLWLPREERTVTRATVSLGNNHYS